jgi:hypothetical protein
LDFSGRPTIVYGYHRMLLYTIQHTLTQDALKKETAAVYTSIKKICEREN